MNIARIAAMALLLAACSGELPHDAPYDVQSPVGKQARSSVTGSVALEGEADAAQVAVQLVNGARTYSAATHADGRFEITGVVPGAYRLTLDTRFFAGVTENAEVTLGAKLDLGRLTLRARRSAVVGSALVERLVGGQPRSSGGVLLALAKTGSIRSGAAAAPGFRAAAATDAALTTVSLPDGSYAFADVPAGRYDLTASTDDAGTQSAGEVTVTGDGTVSVAAVVLRPLTGFFTIEGTAGGLVSTRYTQTAAVTLKLSGFNAEQMKIAQSADGTMAGCVLPANGETLAAVKGLTLTGGEGEKLVCVRFVAGDGRETETLTSTITWDQTAPSPVVVNAAAPSGYVSATSVLVSVAAADAVSGVQAVRYSTTAGGVTAASAAPFQPTLLLPLATEGPVTYWLQIVDAAGNAAPPRSVTIVRDTAAPTLAVGVKSGARTLANNAVVSSPVLTLDLSAADASPLEVQIVNNGAAGLWEPYASPKTVSLAAPSGAAGENRTLTVRLRDAAGNTAVPFDFQVWLDTQGPLSPAVTILGKGTGNTVTSPTLSVALAASGADAVELAYDPGFLTSLGVWSSLAATSVTLPGGDGLKTLYARFFDAAGNASAVVGDSVNVDTSPPAVPSFRIATASPTNSATLALDFAAADAAEVELAAGPACGGPRYPYASAPSSIGVAPGDGARSVSVRFWDAAGNATACLTRSIELDQTPPGVVSLQVNGGAVRTADRLVTVTSAVDGASLMQLSENAAFSGAAWQPVTSPAYVTLSAGDGTKTVYARFRDAAGNTALAAASLALDTAPPVAGTLVVAGGAAVTSATVIPWSVAATETVSWPMQLQVSTDAAFGDAAWQPYAAAGTVFVGAAEGLRLVYARFRDAVGNISPAVAASVTLDRSGPQFGAVTVNGGGRYAASAVPVVFTLGNWSPGDRLQVSVSAAFTGVQEFAANAGANTAMYALAGPDGAKTLYLRGVDALGNAGGAYAYALTRDTVAPAVVGPQAVELASGAVYATSRMVSLDLNVTGASAMLLSAAPDFAGAAWEPFAASTVWFLTPAEGVQTVYAEFRDDAGNLIGAFHDDVTLDTLAPTSPALAINGGAAYAMSPGVDLTLAAAGAVGMQLSNDGVFDVEPVVAYATSYLGWPLDGADGVKAVYARFLDAAGNASAVAQAYIVLDTSPPVAGTPAVNAGAAYTSQPIVSLTLPASGADAMYVSEGACGAGAAWAGYTSTVPFALAATQGTHRVWARYRDAAGNLSACVSAAVYLDQTFYSPGLGLSITGKENMAGNTSDTTVTLQFGSVSTDATQVRVANDASFASANWMAYPGATMAWSLPPVDGAKTVYAQLRDAAGNLSSPISAGIVLDQTGPDTPLLAITDGNGDGFALSSTTVELGWNAAPGASRYDVERSVLGYSPGYGPLVTLGAGAVSYTDAITDATRGLPHYYRLRARDALGNLSAWSLPAATVPFAPEDKLYWVRTQAGTHYDFPPHRGTYALRANYLAASIGKLPSETALNPDATEWTRAYDPRVAFDPTLQLRTANQDNTLVYQSDFTLGTSFYRFFGLPGAVGSWQPSFSREGFVHLYWISNGAPMPLRHATNASGTWTYDTVDAADSIIIGSTVDRNGAAYALYYASGALRWATNRSGAWASQPVFGAPGYCYKGRLAVGGDLSVHIMYGDAVGGRVRYATDKSGVWTVVDTITGLNPTGDFDFADVDLALSATDAPIGGYHGYYWDSNVVQVGLLTRPAAVWIAATLGTWAGGFDMGGTIRTLIDDEGVGHAVYDDQIAGHATEYWTNRTGPWVMTSLGNAGAPVMLQNDAGDVVLSYYATQGMTIALSRQGQWSTQQIPDSVGWWYQYMHPLRNGKLQMLTYLNGYAQPFFLAAFDGPVLPAVHTPARYAETSLAYDTSERATLAYRDQVNQDLHFLRLDGNAWTELYTDTVGNVGRKPYHVYDAGGKVHLLSLDQTMNDAVVYATNARGSWEKRTVDGTIGMNIADGLVVDGGAIVAFYSEQVGLYQARAASVTAAVTSPWSITQLQTCTLYPTPSARARAGVIHLAFYCGQSGGVLKYGRYSGGSWAFTNLDASDGNWNFGAPALALDTAGEPHIAYYDSANTALKYATHTPAGWTLETVDEPGLVGAYSQLVLDAQNAAHIVYSADYLGGVSRYATNASGRWVIQDLFTVGPGSVTALALSPDGGLSALWMPNTGAYSYLTFGFQGTLAPANIRRVTAY
jgi:hypothetical protein